MTWKHNPDIKSHELEISSENLIQDAPAMCVCHTDSSGVDMLFSRLGKTIEKSSDQKGEPCIRMTKGATECVVRPIPLGVVTVRKAGGVRDQHEERFP